MKPENGRYARFVRVYGEDGNGEYEGQSSLDSNSSLGNLLNDSDINIDQKPKDKPPPLFINPQTTESPYFKKK